MKTIILGASGLLGQHIAAQWPAPCAAPSHAELDIHNYAAVAHYMGQHQPGLVINCTGYNAVDMAQDEPQLAAALNHHAVAQLVQACNAVGASLVHFSTDFVFDGLQCGVPANRPYIESDSANPLCVYGATKLAGERAVLASSGAHYVFRVSWLYGQGGNNFFSQVGTWLQDDRVLKVVADQVSVPNDVARLAQVLVQWQHLWAHLDIVQGEGVAEQFLQQHRGLYHLVGTAAMSRFAYAQQVAQGLGSLAVARLEPVSASAFSAAAVRPAYSAMSSAKFTKVFDICV